MILREASIEELDNLNAFYFEMNRLINTRTDKYNPNNPVFPSPEMVQEAILNHQQFVGTEDGRIACACIANHRCADAYDTANWQLALTRDEFWVLHALRVHPDFEGRGFAKQMLTYAAQQARKLRLKAIRLDVLEGYSVERLYRSLGFRYTDTIEIFYEDIGTPRRFRLLELLL